MQVPVNVLRDGTVKEQEARLSHLSKYRASLILIKRFIGLAFGQSVETLTKTNEAVALLTLYVMTASTYNWALLSVSQLKERPTLLARSDYASSG